MICCKAEDRARCPEKLDSCLSTTCPGTNLYGIDHGTNDVHRLRTQGFIVEQELQAPNLSPAEIAEFRMEIEIRAF